MELKQAIAELRKNEKRKFDQTVDLLVSLKGLDIKKNNLSFVVNVPHKFKEKKVCAFFENKSSEQGIKVVTRPEFERYKDKKELKNLVRDYDAFIGNMKLMPAVASTFGKALGPTGKMPSPQLGIIPDENPATIKNVLDKISKSVKIRAKDPSIKVSVGKESMSDDNLTENIKAVYHGIMGALPSKKDNIKKVMVKLTMSKPIILEIV